MCQCLAVVGRIVIGILSVLFAILGFVFLVLGIMVKVQADAISQLFQPLIEMAKAQASSATGGTLDLPTDNFNIAELVGGLAIAFIVLGIVMLFIGVFGVAGACCQVKCMLIVYLVIVGLLLISQIILVIIAAVNRSILTDPAKPGIKSSLQQEFQGVNGTDAISLVWNTLMNGLQCCGVDNSADFDNAAKWQSTWGGPPENYQTPAACCKTGLYTSTDQTCAKAATTSNNNKDIGCFNKLWDFIFTGTPFIIFACADIGGFLLLTFFAAVILHSIIKKAKVGMA